MTEKNAWGGPSIMLWGAIGLNVKFGPVIFHNLGRWSNSSPLHRSSSETACCAAFRTSSKQDVPEG